MHTVWEPPASHCHHLLSGPVDTFPMYPASARREGPGAKHLPFTMRNPRTRGTSDVLESTQPAIMFHGRAEPLTKLLIGYIIVWQPFSSDSKQNEYSGWVLRTSSQVDSHSLLKVVVMNVKAMLQNRWVSNVFICVNPSLWLCLHVTFCILPVDWSPKFRGKLYCSKNKDF